MAGIVSTRPGLLRRHAQHGFTLTELAIVIGIIGLLLGGVWVAAVSVQKNSRNSQAAQDILTMVANLRSTFMAINTFTSGTDFDATKNMITAGVIPNDLVTSTTAATNAWNGAVKIITSPTGGGANAFRISYANMPIDACIGIASQIANVGTSDAPINLITGATTTAIPYNGNPAPTAPCTGTLTGLCMAAISPLCVAAGAGGVFTLAFDFRIH